MRVYAGVDIIELARLERAFARFGERFLRRVYTPEERRRYGQRPAELAARFAGKEAVSKVLGTGFAGVSWTEIEILNDPRGKPTVHLAGRAAQRATELGVVHVEISLSHSRTDVVAFAVGYGGE